MKQFDNIRYAYSIHMKDLWMLQDSILGPNPPLFYITRRITCQIVSDVKTVTNLELINETV